MRIPRTVPFALLASAILYGAAMFSRYALPAMAWEAAVGIPHALVARIFGYVVLASLSLAAMALCRDIPWSEFGFLRGRSRWLGLGGLAIALGMASSLIIKSSGGAGLDDAMAGISPTGVLVTLLLATCVEELFVRGWIQGLIAPSGQQKMRLRGNAISVPVATSALTFGAMHLSLTLTKIDAITIGSILAFTTLLGLLAGLARERTGGLLPAIGTHLAGNVGGILGGIAYAIATGATAHAG